jgi:TIR domain
MPKGKDMEFKYSCFISYRHHQNQLIERFITDLQEALDSELTLTTDLPVYVDRQLQAGDHFNKAIEKALCESVCMIMVFTPTYFNIKSPYCAREYKAMEQLEQRRLALLRAASAREHGLIIPIVLRGSDILPAPIKSRRQCHDLSRFSLRDTKIIRHREYHNAILAIAKYIYERFLDFNSLPINEECDEFRLPTEGEIMGWLKPIADSYRPSLPLHEENR